MSKIPLPKGARRIAPAPHMAALVHHRTGRLVWRHYGDSEGSVVAAIHKVLDRQDQAEVEAGAFSIDYSSYCAECNTYHHPEADCS